MSEVWETSSVAAEPKAQSAGAMLRRAREASGLHVAALAVALKVPVRKLEALEDDRYDLMPDLVFVRGLAASVCRTLKIDAQPVLDLLPQTSAPRLLRDDQGINTPFRAPSDHAPPTWRDQVTKPVSLLVFGIVIAAIVLWFLPITRWDGASHSAAKDEPVTSVPASPVAATEPALPVPATSEPAPTPEPVPSLVPSASMPAPAASMLAANNGAAPAVIPAALTVAQPPVASSETAASPEPATGIVVFKARGPSWVEVTDAKGAVAVRKTLAAGESVGATGALPLHVTVGRSDVTDVKVRGKAFDTQPFLRPDNVARFDVK